MEDFVNFDLAKKLKEKGFNIPFYFFYRTDDKLLHHAHVTNPLVYGEWVDDEVIIAPTISQIMKWLREEKAIHLNVVLWEKGWYCDVWRFEYYEEEKEYAYKREYQTNDYNNYNYEQAALAGIEYVLDNLI